MVVKDADGRRGGLALFWRRRVDVRLRGKDKYYVDAEVVEENGVNWRLT